jgi:hypothetical protein
VYKRILTVSDPHFPYNHPDIFEFLEEIKKVYRPDLIVFMGDETDGHSFSFHDHDPDLMAPRDELQTAITRLKWLYKIFPKAFVLESNHGSLVYRKQKVSGLPRFVFKSYNQMLEAPKGWVWVPDLTVKMSNGNKVYFCHGKTSDVTKLSQSMGMCAVQGHYHEKFKIEYWGNPEGLYWGMQTGCLIENESLAFAYNKVNLKRPVIGTGIILNGHPKLLPMVLNKNGRWIGKLL